CRSLFSTLFPYTTLFRSHQSIVCVPRQAIDDCGCGGFCIGTSRVILWGHQPGLLSWEMDWGNGRMGMFGRWRVTQRSVAMRRCRSEEHTSELQSRENLVC